MLAFLQSFMSQSVSPEDALTQYIYDKNKQAMSTIYNAYANDLYHFLLSLSNPETAKDIAQKTWLLLLEHPEKCNASGSLKSWLFKVARNALIDEIRKTKREESISNVDESAFLDQATALQTDAKDNNHLPHEDAFDVYFERALMALSFHQREAFCLQQEGFSLSDIAHITVSKKETIKTRLRYAKERLKRALESLNEQ